MEQAPFVEKIDGSHVRDVVQAAVEILRERPAAEISPSAAVNSFEADALRAEIIAVGRKLWERRYVDGNGGNISARLNSSYVLCTPTMISKRDLQPADICLTDLDGNILAGDRLRTSELLLHLEIYRANPRARAVVHCHPPHATAFSITGSAPPNGYISEYEVFIGPVAVAPYETPGTQAFAQTVLPFVQDHNTILLSNHGVVCWSDSVTHAEWLAEVLETYCSTWLLAQQIGKPLQPIPEAKIEELLMLKRRMGLPDPRLGPAPEVHSPASTADGELERLVERVVERLESRDC
ncbi:MAG TPA: class II aldolase/adducin family protein [Terracidiphilus sp.]|jgi:L-fuculose-phosphate aldolase|nr:class II aldolase/adducin family protein [Terracidiphilus sp.]